MAETITPEQRAEAIIPAALFWEDAAAAMRADIAAAIRAAETAAVEAERAACANVADEMAAEQEARNAAYPKHAEAYPSWRAFPFAYGRVADRIRSRATPTTEADNAR